MITQGWPRIGHYYERHDGTIRRVDEIEPVSYLGAYVQGVSRRPSDPPGRWPGAWGAYLDVFWSNTVREVGAPPGQEGNADEVR